MRGAILFLCTVHWISCAADPSYDVVIVAEDRDTLEDAFFIDLYLVRDGCLETNAIVEQHRFRPLEGAPQLAAVSPGRYGFSARVYDDDCDVRWAACTEMILEEDGAGLVELTLADIDGPRCDDDLACNGEERCDFTLGCIAGDAVECRDEHNCTIDRCMEPSGACFFDPQGDDCPEDQPEPEVCRADACQDDDLCNGRERCVENVCAPAEAPLCGGPFAAEECPEEACDDEDGACADFDDDGYHCGIDCNDGDDRVHPEAEELCNDEDDDCDEQVDEQLSDC